MNLITEALSKFKNSEPVFIATLSEDKSSVKFVPENPYVPNPQDYTDPIDVLIAEQFRESFNRDDKRFVCNLDYMDVWRHIRDTLVDVYEQHSEAKKPRQTSLYKWLEYISYNEGFVHLYRYLAENANERFRFDGDANNPHVKNFLAILELMKEKYEK